MSATMNARLSEQDLA